LLEHLGVKTILMVSAVYSHSMVGVLVPGKGARYEYDGKEYLVAELTADVDIGMIDGTMADPKGWIPVDFATVAD
jgi:acyl CoA:acetate/3-ketoacid CoA transferase alpha subunit